MQAKKNYIYTGADESKVHFWSSYVSQLVRLQTKGKERERGVRDEAETFYLTEKWKTHKEET